MTLNYKHEVIVEDISLSKDPITLKMSNVHALECCPFRREIKNKKQPSNTALEKPRPHARPRERKDARWGVVRIVTAINIGYAKN